MTKEMTEDVVDKVTVQPRGISRPKLPVGTARWVVIVLILLLALASAVLAFDDGRSAARDRRAVEASNVGTERVAALLSYTPSTVRSDLDSELGWLGGDFHDDYAELVEKTIAPAATKAGITVKAEVVASGVEKVDGDKVTLLMFINVDTTAKKIKTPRLTGSRVRVVLQEDGDDWKIVSFTPLQGAKFSLE